MEDERPGSLDCIVRAARSGDQACRSISRAGAVHAREFSSFLLPDDEEDIRRLFPAAEFVTIPGAGHWSLPIHPARFKESVFAFLRTCSGEIRHSSGPLLRPEVRTNWLG